MNYISYRLLFSIVGLLWSCGNNSSKQITEEKETEFLSVSGKQFVLGGMELGELSKQPFSTVVRANGVLDVPPGNKASVSAYFEGYIKQIQLLEGEEVRKGQTLFILENPKYTKVQQTFLEAKNQLNYLKLDYQRQKDLAEHNINSQKTLLKAEADYETTLANYKSLEKKLTLMNIDPAKVLPTKLRSTILVKAPISGYVTSINISRGMFLRPSDIALTILNPNHMHVELNIFEKDLAKIKVGQEVNFHIQNHNEKLKAQVHLINKRIDPETRTVNVHCHLINEVQSKLLTVGMYVEAEIKTLNDSLFSLPENAVIDIDGKQFVLIQINTEKSGTYQFVQKEVKIGIRKNNFVQIVNAKEFDTNTKFLIKGAFNLIQE